MVKNIVFKTAGLADICKTTQYDNIYKLSILLLK